MYNAHLLHALLSLHTMPPYLCPSEFTTVETKSNDVRVVPHSPYKRNHLLAIFTRSCTNQFIQQKSAGWFFRTQKSNVQLRQKWLIIISIISRKYYSVSELGSHSSRWVGDECESKVSRHDKRVIARYFFADLLRYLACISASNLSLWSSKYSKRALHRVGRLRCPWLQITIARSRCAPSTLPRGPLVRPGFLLLVQAMMVVVLVVFYLAS